MIGKKRIYQSHWRTGMAPRGSMMVIQSRSSWFAPFAPHLPEIDLIDLEEQAGDPTSVSAKPEYPRHNGHFLGRHPREDVINTIYVYNTPATLNDS